MGLAYWRGIDIFKINSGVSIYDIFPQCRKGDLDGDYCVYTHHNISDGAIFYVGKGLKKRPYNRSARSAEWIEKASQGYTVSIFLNNIDGEISLEIEKLLINIIGIDNLVNKVLGGGGAAGFKHSEHTKMKMSERVFGKNNPMFGMYGALNPNFGVPMSEERKQSLRKPRPEVTGNLNGAANRNGYHFSHRDGDEFIGTCYDMYTKYQLPQRAIQRIVRGERKISHGWIVSSVEPKPKS